MYCCSGADRNWKSSNARARLVAAGLLFFAANLSAADDRSKSAPVEIMQAWGSWGTEYRNTDSLAVVTLPTGAVRLFATSKSGDYVDIYDAGNGEQVGRVGERGDKPGQFDRPNGIAAVNVPISSRGDTRPAIVVVERDGRRVQAIWADTLKPAGILATKLRKPYGIAVSYEQKSPLLYVTDAESAPTERVHVYRLARLEEELRAELVRSFGEAEGPGEVELPESIAVDDAGDRVFVCDEQVGEKNVKVYTRKGEFTGKTFAGGHIEGEPEGLVVWQPEGGRRVVILTDQRPSFSVWRVYDAETFAHIGNFTGSPKIANSDGVAIFPAALGNYMHGLFFAVNDDSDIRAYDLSTIAEKIFNK